MLNLSKESTFLINYYDSLLNSSNKDFKFSPTNNKKSIFLSLQEKIFNNLNYIYNIFNKDFSNIKDFRQIYSHNTREHTTLIQNVYNKHFINNRFIDNKIVDYIKNKPSSLLTYNLLLDNKKIRINFIVYTKISQKQLINFDKNVKAMLAKIYLISKLTNNDICSKHGLSIYLFFTPFKRELAKNSQILGATNVNGGFCYGCVPHGEIIIYRQEEAFKVFSHELIHNFGVDKYFWEFISNVKINNSKENKIYNKFLDNFNIVREKDLGLQECLVEFWGEFINNAIYSYIYANECNLSTYKQKFKFYNHIFKTIMKFEITHSFFQTTKILHHYNINYTDILSKYNTNSKFRENSHVFSYYILKLYLIYNYTEFINSGISITRENSIKFNYSLQNMINFLNYIISVSNANSLLTNFKFMQKNFLFLKSQNKCREINYLLNNLRMSVIEYS